MTDLNNLLKILLDSEIDFVLIGGFAAVLHGSSQVTQDLDVALVLSAENIEKLRHTLRGYHPKHRMNPGFQPSLDEIPRPGESLNNLYLKTDLGILDILSEVKPIGDFNKVKANAIKVTLFNRPCKVISLDDLIEVKGAMNRPKDRSTLSELLEIKKLLQSK
jgi:hypothetical protein